MDRNAFRDLKWKNIDSRIVKAALVSVYVKDAFGDEIPPVQFQYRALEAERGREFGVRVPVVLDTDRIVECCPWRCWPRQWSGSRRRACRRRP